MKSLLLHGAIFLIAILLQNKISAQQWVNLSSVSPQEVSVTNIVNDSYGIDFEISVAGFFKKDSTVAGNTYHKIGIGGCGLDTKVGKPQLPLIRQMVAIPECTNVTATLSNYTYTILNDYYIFPAPELVEVQQNGYTSLVEQFAIDNQAYSQNSWYPSESIYINSISYLREQKVAEVYIAPIQFNPVTHQIRIINSCDVSLNFINPSGSNNKNLGIFSSLATNTLLNYNLSNISPLINDNSVNSGSVEWINLTSISQADNIVADYLIITAGKFYQYQNQNSEIYRLAQHRASYNGYKVVILNVEDIVSDQVGFEYIDLYSNTYDVDFKNERRIRECIRHIYLNGFAPNTYDHHLGYVLLLGDAKLSTSYPGTHLYHGVPPAHDPYPVKLHEEFDPNTLVAPSNDYYYSCLTTISPWNFDRIGDIFIGRLPADNFIQLHNVVQKIIDYETEATFNQSKQNLFANSEFNANGNRQYFVHPQGIYNYFLPSIITSPYCFNYWNQETTTGINSLVVNDINSGRKMFTYYGEGTQTQLGIGLDTNYIKSNLSNQFKNPFLFAYCCNAGYYEDEIITVDGFAEVCMKYSPADGFIGSLAKVNPVTLEYNNNFPITQPSNFYDWFEFNLWNKLNSISGALVFETKLIAPDNPYSLNNSRFCFQLFCDPALNLFAEGYQVTHNVTLNGEIYISNEVRVKPGSTLTVAAGTHVHFINNGKLIIESGATLTILNQSTLTTAFDGVSDNNYLVVYGNINNFNRVSFTATTGLHWGGLQVSNPALNLSFNFSTSFSHCGLRLVGGTYSFNNTPFADSWLTLNGCSADIQNCQFTNGSYIIGDGMGSKSVGIQIKNCSVLNSPANMEAIRLERYPVYNIENNQITYTDKDGLGLYNCGSLQTRNHSIKDNIITFAGTQPNNNNGIKLYCTFAELFKNNIHHNSIGVSLLNTSNTIFTGVSTAPNSSETQIIANNSIYQIYLAQMSSAPQLSYNAIYVDQPNVTPYIKYEIAGYPSPIINVNYNYWGGNNGVHHLFVPTTDLYPYNKFTYNPAYTWNLLSKNSSEVDTCEALYAEAHGYLADSNFLTAIEKYKDVISLYPNHVLAASSIAELFDVYWSCSFDLNELKSFYTSNSITLYEMLAKKGAWLANKCDIYNGNLNQGIAWLDSVAQNPELISDSIYALIELADIYSSDSTKSGYTSSLGSLLPRERAEFISKRKEWIDLLFADQKANPQPTKVGFELGQLAIIPNPTNQDAEIEFVCANDGLITLTITDLKGSRVIEPYILSATTGKNKLKLSRICAGTMLKKGLYLLCLSNESTKVSSKLLIK